MGCTRALAARHPVRRWLPSPPAQGRCARRPRPLRADFAPRQRTLESEMQAQRRRHHHPSLQHNGPVRRHSRGWTGSLWSGQDLSRIHSHNQSRCAQARKRTSVSPGEPTLDTSAIVLRPTCVNVGRCTQMGCNARCFPARGRNGPALAALNPVQCLSMCSHRNALAHMSLLHTLLKFGPGSLPGSRFKFF